jgi:hypothetical protein
VRAGKRLKPHAAATMFRMAVETDRATKNGTAPEPARAFEGLMVRMSEAFA